MRIDERHAVFHQSAFRNPQSPDIGRGLHVLERARPGALSRRVSRAANRAALTAANFPKTRR
jgi:hypothetical protein